MKTGENSNKFSVYVDCKDAFKWMKSFFVFMKMQPEAAPKNE
jgi:hypothetical protein